MFLIKQENNCGFVLFVLLYNITHSLIVDSPPGTKGTQRAQRGQSQGGQSQGGQSQGGEGGRKAQIQGRTRCSSTRGKEGEEEERKEGEAQARPHAHHCQRNHSSG